MIEQIQLPASAVAQLLRVLLPDATYGNSSAAPGSPSDPWQLIGLNPQPLPPKTGPLLEPWMQLPWQTPSGELVAVAHADALLQEFTTLGRLASLFDGQVAERAVDQGLSLIAELDELCPRWPIPKIWRRLPQPPRPPRPNEDMSGTELLIYGMRLLDGVDGVGHEKLADAIGGLASRSLEIAVTRAS